jgi:hypothetical protein
MTMGTNRGRAGRWALVPAALLLLLLCVVPETFAKDRPGGGPSWLTPGQIRRIYARRGGNRGSSNPTTIPIVDGDFMFMVDWTRTQLGLDQAQVLTRGAGTLVAVLDGGFNLRQPEIAPHLAWFGYDAIDQDADPEDLGNGIDDDGDGVPDGGVGHGTFVAGMILQVAPEATIVPIRIRDDEGWGTDWELVRGLQYALAIGADVVNISGESPHGHTAQVTNLLRELGDAGATVVVSAGNDGTDQVSDLGAGTGALTVGAVDRDGFLADFSNYTWDTSTRMVFAPGVDLYGPLGTPTDGSDGYWSGTSFSTALVSGGCALLHALQPWMRPEDVANRLAWSGLPVGSRQGWTLPFTQVQLGWAVWR